MIKNTNIDINELKIEDVIDINMLQNFQDNFAKSMDISSITVDRNGIPVTKTSCYTSFCKDYIHNTKIGDERCAECHSKSGVKAAKLGRPYIYTCHAGLIDFAAPILVDGKHIGTILGGQILKEKPKEEKYRKIANETGIDEDKLVKAVKKIKIMSEKNMKASAEVLFIFANALSKIGYEELTLKKLSQNLQSEVLKKNVLLEEAEKCNKAKTQLFSTISHELKTPLNIIFSSIQLIENIYSSPAKGKTSAILKYSKIMKQNCYRLIRLINNVIDMNKIELGFYSLKLKNSNIIKIIEDITLSVVEYARLKNINIVFDTEIEEKITACDLEKLERILLNLLSNAIKFNKPHGSIFVNIFDRNEYILISVKDTGIGIPEDMIDKIFGTFTQVDSSYRRIAEGSGIGLSIVKSLVEMQGGEISVNSKLGIGSEFIIKMPVRLIENENNMIYEKTLNDYVEKIKIEFSDIYL